MDVYALVGATGTGKSHHASFVARQVGAECIIDDGLLICGAKVVAGSSAKREATALAAVRRAIFRDPGHAQEVRGSLRAIKPERILILGTSREMIHNICDALDLPRPERYVEIGEVSSPDEIRHARRIRRMEGKHVIPAPTLEVKKSFSGYMVDPLRFLYTGRGRRGGKQEPVLVEKSMVRPTFSSLGRFFIADSVVGAIAERAARGVPGVAGCSRVAVESRREGVVIVLDLALLYGTRLVPALTAARARAREAVEQMTALNVLNLEVVARKVVLEPPAAESPVLPEVPPPVASAPAAAEHPSPDAEPAGGEPS